MKDLTPALKSHIRQGVTTLCTCLEIIRKDGRSFRFTDHDQVLRIGSSEYVPYSSFARTSITTGLDLEVDQMEVRGILNSKHIARADVASGLFDFAEVRVFIVNWMEPDSGSTTLRTGWLGEVTMNEDSTFIAELRGLTQVYTYRIGEGYAPECRADLGDRRCRVAISPADWRPGGYYRRGDVVRGIINVATGYLNLSLQNPSFDNDAATLPVTVRDIEGWTSYGDPRGRWTVRQTPFFGLGGKDSYAAFGTDDGWTLSDVTNNDGDGHTVADIGMYQDVDLIAQGGDAVQLDTGLCRLFATVWYACINPKEAGARFRVFALDGAGVQIGASAIYDTGLKKTAEDRWFQEIVRDILIPAGTRRLRVDLFAHKRSRYSEGAAFDTVTLAVNFPDGTLGSSSQYGDVAFQCITAGTSGAEEPAWSNLLGDTIQDGAVTWKAVKSYKKSMTVIGTSDGGRTVVTSALGDAVGYYDGGLMIWETGPNAGRAQEIKVSAAASVTLFQRPYHIPRAGDRFVIHPGCDKTRASCKDKFANILNFRGEPDVPGQDKYYQTPNAPAM
ncbi:hypothetical protein PAPPERLAPAPP_05620 [Brevundimonas phage vB_BpoS-Papperlapapp]|uniref:Bacteriophage phiJL001 Gp84 C-terminal domain-containing protein n=2 Tax=Marchewkavirus TaxID=3425052 RepID=A0A9E7SLX1_9CAUD|nr:hypothetical protein KABACHOK_03990 [Brevundimonas phage vB_BpoS-Kabachok]USN14927.1 hypothetical protein DOMOVOI_04560 [Brevundimonas phage vB_BpoS-Domovoi]USN16300.1 hypothetical protein PAPPERLAPAPP_05620 [Brevundimonas phage vB_BpoS-Papperlapapp]